MGTCIIDGGYKCIISRLLLSSAEMCLKFFGQKVHTDQTAHLGLQYLPL